jgi:NADH dehydrogenase FAD-containing subunit
MKVTDQTSVFAIGDLSTADAKMAAFVGRQAATVAANVTALASGSVELVDYESMGPGIAVPIGPSGGAVQFPGRDEIVGREVISDLKGRAMGVDGIAKRFNLAVAARRVTDPRSTD